MLGKGPGPLAKALVPALVLGTLGLTLAIGFDWPALDHQAAGTMAPAFGSPATGVEVSPDSPEFPALHAEMKEKYQGQPVSVAQDVGINCSICHY